MTLAAVDLFAGPGGWSEGLSAIGLADVGLELDAAACATRAAAGHLTIRTDVSTYPPEAFAGRVEGLIASPPCRDFSAAGRKAGINGKDGRLVWEVMRWAEALHPLWIACEQVPPVLPIWQEFAHRLRGMGYSAWTGLLNAADYGVPQTRERAILMAHRRRLVEPPAPTHARNTQPSLFGDDVLPWVSMAEALGWGMTERPSTTLMAYPQSGHTGGAEPLNGGSGARRTYQQAQEAGRWVLHTNRGQRPDGTRQEVDPQARPAPAVTGKSGGQWVLRNNTQENAAERSLEEPAPTLFFGGHLNNVSWRLRPEANVPARSRAGKQTNSTRRTVDEPAPTVAFGNDMASWVFERPATTVQGDQRGGRPGHKDRDKGEQQFAQDAIRITVEEAAILQSFRPDYPFQGTKTKRFEQVGNAVPPRMAAHILSALTGPADPLTVNLSP